MGATLRVDLVGFDGNVIEPDLSFESFDYNRTIGAVGTANFLVPDYYPPGFFSRDSLLYIYRTPQGTHNTNLEPGAMWMTRKIGVDLLTGDMKLSCVDQMDLLTRRLVAYLPTEPQADKNEFEGSGPDFADDLMKEYIYENMGVGAVVSGSGTPDTARYLDDWITIEGDKSEGELVEETASFKYIDATLKSLKAKSRDLGTDVFYDLRCVAINQLLFTTSTLSSTGDRTAGSSSPVIFSVDMGNIANAVMEWDYSSEKTFAYVTGGGRDGGTSWVGVSSGRETLSPFNRIEDHHAAREEYTDSALQDMGAALLDGGRAVARVKGKVIDTSDIQYGKDFFFGDKVTVEANGVRFDCIISSIRNGIKDGAESLDIKLTGEVPIWA